MKRRMIVLLFCCAALVETLAAESGSTVKPREGDYACAIVGTAGYFDTGMLRLSNGDKYQPMQGAMGTYRYEAGTGTIHFEDGAYGGEQITGRYFATVPLRGGIPKKRGPTIILKREVPPSQRAKDMLDFPTQYCYFTAKAGPK